MNKLFNDIVAEAINEKVKTRYEPEQFLQEVFVMGHDIFDNPVRKVLEEGLIESYPPERVVEVLAGMFNLEIGFEKEGQITGACLGTNELRPRRNGCIDIVSTHSGDDVICAVIPSGEHAEHNREALETKLHKYGWYIAACKPFVFRGQEIDGWQVVQFEKKFGIDVTYPIKHNPVFRYLYHICPKSVLPKIMRQGLKPVYKHRTDFNNPDRAYFFVKDLTPDGRRFVAGDFNKNRPANKQEREFCYLRVDTKKMNNNPTFYLDSRMPADSAVYTMDSVTPEAIEVIETFNI